MLSEINLLYYNILIKYNFYITPIINKNFIGYKKILIMDYPLIQTGIIHSPIMIKNTEYNVKFKKKIFLSQKLVTFLHNTDYYIDEEIEFGQFVHKINYMTNEINFGDIVNSDNSIYKDLSLMVGANYIKKKILIYRFINKNTTPFKKIHINI